MYVNAQWNVPGCTILSGHSRLLRAPGIGLVMTKRLIEMMGGGLSAQRARSELAACFGSSWI
jgi:hypothetical protein